MSPFDRIHLRLGRGAIARERLSGLQCDASSGIGVGNDLIERDSVGRTNFN